MPFSTSTRKLGLAAALLAVTTGCTSFDSLVAPTESRQSFAAVWVSASWSGGRTGTPLESRGVFPTTYVGALCPASSLRLENHVTTYSAFPLGDALILTNLCGNVLYVAVCRTSGASGGGATIPVCATDPRQTPRSNLNVYRLSPGIAQPVGTTSVNLSVEVFWCGTGSDFNFSVATPKSGAAPTDCVQVN